MQGIFPISTNNLSELNIPELEYQKKKSSLLMRKAHKLKVAEGQVKQANTHRKRVINLDDISKLYRDHLDLSTGGNDIYWTRRQLNIHMANIWYAFQGDAIDKTLYKKWSQNANEYYLQSRGISAPSIEDARPEVQNACIDILRNKRVSLLAPEMPPSLRGIGSHHYEHSSNVFNSNLAILMLIFVLMYFIKRLSISSPSHRDPDHRKKPSLSMRAKTKPRAPLENKSAQDATENALLWATSLEPEKTTTTELPSWTPNR